MHELSELQRIGNFRVTDRSLQLACNKFHTDLTDTAVIPEHAVVLNVGSGLYRTFEKDLSQKRPDIRFISLDPSLGIVTIDNDGVWTTQDFRIADWGDEEVVDYSYENGERKFSNIFKHDEKAIAYDRERKRRVGEIPGALASFATAMPLKSNIIDIAFDYFGPIEYLSTLEEKQTYLLELKRVTKPSGTIFLSGLTYDEKTMVKEIGFTYRGIGIAACESFILTKI